MPDPTRAPTHTAGPWKVTSKYEGEQWPDWIVAGTGMRIAKVAIHSGDDQHIGNARLLAAAPLLLAACEDVIVSELSGTIELHTLLRNELRAAIAAARGE